ncbi:MAG: HEAT repeat domain-containing protein [Planctomycetota bacterium]
MMMMRCLCGLMMWLALVPLCRANAQDPNGVTGAVTGAGQQELVDRFRSAADEAARVAIYRELMADRAAAMRALPVMLAQLRWSESAALLPDHRHALRVIGSIGAVGPAGQAAAARSVPRIAAMLAPDPRSDERWPVDTIRVAASTLMQLGDAGREALLASFDRPCVWTHAKLAAAIGAMAAQPRDAVLIPLARLALLHRRDCVRRCAQLAVVALCHSPPRVPDEQALTWTPQWRERDDLSVAMLPALHAAGVLASRPVEARQLLTGILDRYDGVERDRVRGEATEVLASGLVGAGAVRHNETPPRVHEPETRMRVTRRAPRLAIWSLAIFHIWSAPLSAQDPTPPQAPDPPQTPQAPQTPSDQVKALTELMLSADYDVRMAEYKRLEAAGKESAWAVPALRGVINNDPDATGPLHIDTIPALKVIAAIGLDARDLLPQLKALLDHKGLVNGPVGDLYREVTRALLRLGEPGRDALLDAMETREAWSYGPAVAPAFAQIAQLPADVMLMPMSRVALLHPSFTARLVAQRVVVICATHPDDPPTERALQSVTAPEVPLDVLPALERAGFWQTHAAAMLQLAVDVLSSPDIGDRDAQLERELRDQMMSQIADPQRGPLPVALCEQMLAALTSHALLPPARRLLAIATRHMTETDVVPPLLRVIADDESWWVRQAAIEALAAIGRPRAAGSVPALIRVLRDRNDPLRIHAAHALKVLMPATDASELLIPMLSAGDDLDGSAIAFRTLAAIGAPAAPGLLAQLGAPEGGAAERVMSLLVYLGDDALPAVRTAIADESCAVQLRRRIVDLLDQMPTSDSAGDVLRILKTDADPGVAAAATRALARR